MLITYPIIESSFKMAKCYAFINPKLENPISFFIFPEFSKTKLLKIQYLLHHKLENLQNHLHATTTHWVVSQQYQQECAPFKMLEFSCIEFSMTKLFSKFHTFYTQGLNTITLN
jgi:hypothetical protein